MQSYRVVPVNVMHTPVKANPMRQMYLEPKPIHKKMSHSNYLKEIPVKSTSEVKFADAIPQSMRLDKRDLVNDYSFILEWDWDFTQCQENHIPVPNDICPILFNMSSDDKDNKDKGDGDSDDKDSKDNDTDKDDKDKPDSTKVDD